MSEINKKKIAVLVSGSGSNLQSIIDNVENGNLNCEITYVIADRECYGLQRAEKYGIETLLLDRKIIDNKLANEIIDSTLERCKTDYIVLAGYLSILTEKFIKKWDKRVINIHPSLLPKFGGKGMYGIKVHEAVIKAGEKESGCTVHFVTNEIDAGEIITNVKVPVLEDDTPETLQKRVLEQEHKLLIKGIKKIL
ncbi:MULTISPECIES: phosphoribosylglycinamide formyltransferase [Fusobacterium]|jgi:phosphoribosylglycinamide formyltransferase|uniref:phosphoribosylglycinamide formyltransferase n=1 Tax=Fusobacterium TaxID=848 RepID=UPI001CB420A6|nr:phosphoribosylglycinamide formyltransferase [Fusobacterium pseudoperiodonticum]MBF1203497.1 phosphoribosylglycinamide formyltransferase [Fusobacterium periodonticum]MDU2234769.1 phosphoribosylglycinamide formyltransferase [Fusobacterium periodonticum]